MPPATAPPLPASNSACFGSKAPRQLQITHTETGEDVEIALRGEIDLLTADALERELRVAPGSHAHRVRVDMRGVQFVDLCGLRCLLRVQRRARADGHGLVLCHLPPQTRRLLLIVQALSAGPMVKRP